MIFAKKADGWFWLYQWFLSAGQQWSIIILMLYKYCLNIHTFFLVACTPGVQNMNSEKGVTWASTTRTKTTPTAAPNSTAQTREKSHFRTGLTTRKWVNFVSAGFSGEEELGGEFLSDLLWLTQKIIIWFTRYLKQWLTDWRQMII